MDRQRIRELIRQAQAAEVAGEPRLAATLLGQAASIHLEGRELARASTLVRHGLRLQPGRADLLELLSLAAPGEPVELRPVPDEPLHIVPSNLPEVRTGRAVAEEALEVVPAEHPELAPGLSSEDEPIQVVPIDLPTRLNAGPRGLKLAERGPTPADPSIDCWCSFCCRPRSEVGPMAAGPAGAFICVRCLETASGLLGRGVGPVASGKRADPPPASPPAAQSGAQPAADFVEAAVILSKRLGWSLADVRSLGPDGAGRALAKLADLEGPRRAKRPGAAAKKKPPKRRPAGRSRRG